MDLVELLGSCAELAGASEGSLQRLAAALARTDRARGSTVFQEGDSADSVYVVEAGVVRLTSTQGAPPGIIADLEAGELLGDMTALTGNPRTATATALTNSVLWCIDAENFRSVVADDAGLAMNLMVQAMELVLRKDLDVVIGNQRMRELDWVLGVERETARRLKLRDEEKSERVAMVVHDVRSPVTVMTASADLLRKRWEAFDSESVNKLLNAIVSQGRHLLSLVERTLDVASIESGSITIESVPFDVAGLVRRMAADLDEAFENAVIEVRAPADLPQVVGDEDRVQQILANLLSNSMKFSEPGSPILVECDRRDGFVCTSINDRGVGIEADDIRRVFDKFARASGPAQEVQGNGLGLYICRRLVEAQGGVIWADSQPGMGSTFRFTLPVAE